MKIEAKVREDRGTAKTPEWRTIGYKSFTFPDGQPHITLNERVAFCDLVVTISLTSPADLFELLMVKDILDQGKNKVHLKIEYLMGARMDRRIDDQQPFTLKIVTDIINQGKFDEISVLDPHSNKSLDLLDPKAYARFPIKAIQNILANCDPAVTSVVCPDGGAHDRVEQAIHGLGFTTVYCDKVRDPQNGKLSGFKILNPEQVRQDCVIIDDICDGGRTFTGLAELLRISGAEHITLFVTHGIFSKGPHLEGIDEIHTTQSFPKLPQSRSLRTKAQSASPPPPSPPPPETDPGVEIREGGCGGTFVKK